MGLFLKVHMPKEYGVWGLEVPSLATPSLPHAAYLPEKVQGLDQGKGAGSETH